jgi:hypothetical protein
MEYRRNWSEDGFYFVHPICVIGLIIGLKFQKGTSRMRLVRSDIPASAYKHIDILHFDSIVPVFNSFNPIQLIDGEYYIVRDNYNLFLKEMGRKELTLYWFRKIEERTKKEYKLIKKIKQVKK